MVVIPDEMLKKDRHPDPHFEPEELLYRRFSPDDFDGDTLSVDAIELPDMSCNRSKYGPPTWCLLVEGCEHWGVCGFEVRDIPQVQYFTDIRYDFGPEHVPHKRNYPHSEVRVFRDGTRIDPAHAGALIPAAHLQWRQRLLWNIRIIIEPFAGESSV
jgi:hypothetical protein